MSETVSQKKLFFMTLGLVLFALAIVVSIIVTSANYKKRVEKSYWIDKNFQRISKSVGLTGFLRDHGVIPEGEEIQYFSDYEIKVYVYSRRVKIVTQPKDYSTKTYAIKTRPVITIYSDKRGYAKGLDVAFEHASLNWPGKETQPGEISLQLKKIASKLPYEVLKREYWVLKRYGNYEILRDIDPRPRPSGWRVLYDDYVKHHSKKKK